MTPRLVQVFVYYRVRLSEAAPVIAAIAQFQASLQATMPGLTGTLSRRLDDGSELLTLMETYVHAGASSEDWPRDVERLAQQQRFVASIVGERHVEIFVPCA